MRLSAAIGSVALVLEVITILVDVIGRAFGHPLFGSRDIITMAMVIVVFGGMALCDRVGGHISVDLLERHYPGWLNRWVEHPVRRSGCGRFRLHCLRRAGQCENQPDAEPEHQSYPLAQGMVPIRACGVLVADCCGDGPARRRDGPAWPRRNSADGAAVMTIEAIGTLGLGVLIVLLLLRVPVALSMFLVGFVGTIILSGWNAAFGLLASESFTLASSPELVVVPLFVFMGNIASTSGMSRKLYDAAYALIGHIRGGLALATVIGCGGFAALSGSSVASALTMGRVSLAEMDRFNYDKRLSTGVVAAGGTLGILIPPSTGFVIYAILAEQSIGRLFLAGVLPGLLLLLLFLVAVMMIVYLRPDSGPRGPKTSGSQKLRALSGALPIGGIILLTIGGIYGGYFSPVEAAGVGRRGRAGLEPADGHDQLETSVQCRQRERGHDRDRHADPDRRAYP